MFHDDIQTQLTHSIKRNTNEHPIDRIYAEHYNVTHLMKNSSIKIPSDDYKSETKHIIQRQRVIRSFLNKSDEIDFQPSPRKPIILDTQPTFLSITSISSLPSPSISELNDQSTNNNNRQQKIDRHSPLLIRRHRPTMENVSFNQQMLDTPNASPNQLSFSLPTSFIFRNRPSRVVRSDRSSYKIKDRISSPRIKTLKYTKPSNEIKQNLFNSKSTYQNKSSLIPILTSTLIEQETTHNRTLTDTLRSKSQPVRLPKSRLSHQLQLERINTTLKSNDLQDLYISPRLVYSSQQDMDIHTNSMQKKESILEEWEDLKSNATDVVSDEDESIHSSGNSSTSTCHSQTYIEENQDKSSTFILGNGLPESQHSSIQRKIPPRRRRRHAYNIPLPPVVEHDEEEETGDNFR
ncbi:hypothetical protein I4U23_008331 [Adineta vaga]|nr:hypothetical protein I4U23_008331 [Adineta vaga]